MTFTVECTFYAGRAFRGDVEVAGNNLSKTLRCVVRITSLRRDSHPGSPGGYVFGRCGSRGERRDGPADGSMRGRSTFGRVMLC